MKKSGFLVAALALAGTVFIAPPALCQQPPPVPGVDLDKLSDAQRALFLQIADEQFCPCGKPQSFKDSLMKPETCPPATRLGQLLADELAAGQSKKDAVRALLRKIADLNARFDFDVKDSPRVGDQTSRVVVVVFSDFECPFCREVSKPLKELAQKDPDVAVAYKFYPLTFHKHAREAARAALAAHRQGRFWEMHDAIFEHQKELDETTLLELAKKVGLDMKRFKADLASSDLDARIDADYAEGTKAGVEGTPTLFVNGLICEHIEDLGAAIEAARE